jgi:outer membrane protein OmpA-like peptidoglycan-associated protein
MKAWLAAVALSMLAMVPRSGHAEPASPQGTLQAFLEQATAVMREAGEPRQAWSDVYQLAAPLFDGQTAARRTLGAQWERRSSRERAELADVVTGVLARAYLELAKARLPRDAAPTLNVLREDLTGDGAATVRTSVRARDGQDLRLDYLMDRGAGRWRVYDLVIDGISLVENYRAQFARLVRTSSYGDAVAALRRISGAGTAEAAPASAIVAYFASGGAEISDEARAGLDRLAAWLGTHERGRVVVESHSDDRGVARANEALAERRAAAVRRYLVGRGVDGARIETIVHGARQPLCRESTEACWAQNRRVVARLD